MSEVYYDMDPDTYKINNFEYIFKEFGLPVIVVEIGCYYGKTTGALVQKIAPQVPNMQYHAIDPFDTSVDVGEDLEKVYQIFINNLNTFPFKKNIILHREKSFDALVKLRERKITPDIEYVWFITPCGDGGVGGTQKQEQRRERPSGGSRALPGASVGPPTSSQ